MDKKMIERAKMVCAMEFIARQINDEDVFWSWLQNGVADEDVPYGSFDVAKVDEYYLEDKAFKDLMTDFLIVMKNAFKSGGLYCGGIVSDDKDSLK